ncbi:hypothetical protein ABID22_001129 [Pontibacter aydingkolensis]|uniref:Uncharacterized protein n=1 Tax=Pontibacter aydingkolensis TaxID=1911536 RepID=A0ABS7CU66_9BACT|nr:hypothetical protein [Pontibacter aydingkolensis]MBW7467037.1 hypothetical protein [Pontibacter aydingkolensis]
MKIVILIFVLLFSFGASVKKQAKDIKELKVRAELNEFRTYPNLLPVVEIVSSRN